MFIFIMFVFLEKRVSRFFTGVCLKKLMGDRVTFYRSFWKSSLDVRMFFRSIVVMEVNSSMVG